jgi:hypothetical protein
MSEGRPFQTKGKSQCNSHKAGFVLSIFVGQKGSSCGIREEEVTVLHRSN